jgi:hypothetical protein
MYCTVHLSRWRLAGFAATRRDYIETHPTPEPKVISEYSNAKLLTENRRIGEHYFDHPKKAEASRDLHRNRAHVQYMPHK